MRVMMRTGPLVLVLGVAMIGCNQAGNDKPAKSPGDTTADYVLIVEGMH
jgi:hypothetical protein